MLKGERVRVRICSGLSGAAGEESEGSSVCGDRIA